MPLLGGPACGSGVICASWRTHRLRRRGCARLVALLIRLFPPTIHPMVVHFPIALMFTATLVDLVGLGLKRAEIATMGFALETLGLVSLAAAAAAGWISEHAVVITNPAVRALLSAHKRDAVLTSLVFGVVWLFRAARHRRFGLGASWLALAGMVAGLALLSITSSLGGSLVYEHGVGVASVITTVLI